jgi:3-methyladenine DNA glycosylase/8-oxoguanine DNA glycosylase
MRFALGLDEDLSAFRREFARDPLIGRSIRERPWLGPRRRPEPFEALAWAICEQLIEYERAAAIQRRIVASMGPSWAAWDGCARPLRDVPSPAAFAGATPARLESFDLAGSRARLLVRVAREVAKGRLDLYDADHERAWRRLRAIPGVGPWTVEMLALQGQGRYDQLPAGDVGLLKYVGRRLSGGDPWARASEEDVRRFFARYGPWQGLAAVHVGVI